MIRFGPVSPQASAIGLSDVAPADARDARGPLAFVRVFVPGAGARLDGSPDEVPGVAVEDLAQLDRIVRRGVVPTVPRGARVSLDLLPSTVAERPRWERAVGRWERACGCVSSILKKLDVQSRTDIARESALRSATSR